jgi:hypothetical protein
MASVVAILALSGRFRYPDAAEAGRL